MKVVAEIDVPVWPPPCRRHPALQMSGSMDPSTWACAACDSERQRLINSLEDVCDYAEQYGDAGEHFAQTRIARELLAEVKA